MAELTDLKRAYLMGLSDGLKARREIDGITDRFKDEIAAKLGTIEDEFTRQRAIQTAADTERDPATGLN